jgi:hypothetical protein
MISRMDNQVINQKKPLKCYYKMVESPPFYKRIIYGSRPQSPSRISSGQRKK